MVYYGNYIPDGPAFRVDKDKYIAEATKLLANGRFDKPANEKERAEIASTIYKRFIRLLRVYPNKSIASFDELQEALNAAPSVYVVNKALGDLYLSMLYDEHKVETPKLAVIVKVKESKPVISPAVMVWSRLSEGIYDFLDEADRHPIESNDSESILELLCLHLLMNEYVTSYKQMALLISNRKIWSSMAGLWVGQSEDLIVIISPKTMTLLWALWASKTNENWSVSSSRVAGIIKNCLVSKGVIKYSDRLNVTSLKAAVKIEKVLQYSPTEYRLFTQNLKSTPLSTEALYRLITGVGVRKKKAQNATPLKSPYRQLNSWNKGIRNFNRVLAEDELKVVSEWIGELKSKTKSEEDTIRAGELQADMRRWLESESNVSQNPLAWLLVAWMYKLLKDGTKYKSKLTFSTIKDYLSSIAESFVHEFSDTDITLISGLEWAEKLNDVAEIVPGKTKRGRVRYFAEFLIESNLASDMCISDLDINGVGTSVDANILTHYEADRILNLLRQEDSIETNLAQVIFVLGFYLGLRRGEILGLQFDDFYLSDLYSQLHVRLNRYRKLKSTNSARNLPMDCLLPNEALQIITNFLERTDLKIRKKNDLIFDSRIYSKSDLDNAFNLIGKVMRLVTGDDNMRFHHLRHSFCNWTWILININEYSNVNAFQFLNHSYFTSERCDAFCERLGLRNGKSRNRGWILAELLGHSHINTTFASYFHLADIHRFLLDNYFLPPDKWLRALWGYRYKLNHFGAPKLPEKAQELYKKYMVSSFNFEPIDVATDLSGILRSEEPLEQLATIRDLGLYQIYRVIRRYEEKQTYGEIEQGLGVELESVKSLCNQYDLLRDRYCKNHVAYAELRPRDENVLEELVKGYAGSQADLHELTSLSAELLDDLVAGKSNLIRSTNEHSVIAFLKLLKELGVNASQITLEWYVSEQKEETHVGFVKKLESDVSWWSSSVNAIFGFKQVNMWGLVNDSLLGYLAIKDDFHWRTTTDSSDGIHLKYKNRGNVSVRVVANKYVGPDKGEASKRRSKGLVYFLQLLKIYTSCQCSN